MDHPIPQIKKGRKFDQVVAGAREVFLREGFEGATVDAIARAANVSKATLYSYFSDKKLLFLEVAQAECRRQAKTAMVMAEAGLSVEDSLRDVAERMTGFFLSSFGQQVFRICVAEADRFPEIGKTFYRSGPEQARNALASYLEKATARGELQIDDFRLAADQFAELCKADLFSRLIFNMTEEVTEAQVSRVIDGAVRMFMARYGV